MHGRRSLPWNSCTHGTTFEYLFNAVSIQGRCIFASGSPFKPVIYQDKTFHPGILVTIGFHSIIDDILGQGNNAYIFPAIALATVACAARHVEEDLFLIAAQVNSHWGVS